MIVSNDIYTLGTIWRVKYGMKKSNSVTKKKKKMQTIIKYLFFQKTKITFFWLP